MTKIILSFFAVTVLMIPSYVQAEEDLTAKINKAAEQTQQTAENLTETANTVVADTAPSPAASAVPSEALTPPVLDMPSVPSEPAPSNLDAPAAAPPAVTEAIPTDNLEFISGEISTIDEPTQSVTVKLYGETESGTSDKTLKVAVDSTTDITDGEQDRDLKSLTAGTEVDVEYDPATNKATYIFVY